MFTKDVLCVRRCLKCLVRFMSGNIFTSPPKSCDWGNSSFPDRKLRHREGEWPGSGQTAFEAKASGFGGHMSSLCPPLLGLAYSHLHIFRREMYTRWGCCSSPTPAGPSTLLPRSTVKGYCAAALRAPECGLRGGERGLNLSPTPCQLRDLTFLICHMRTIIGTSWGCLRIKGGIKHLCVRATKHWMSVHCHYHWQQALA